MFVDYNVGPVMLMNLTGVKFSLKEIKDMEDHKKLKDKLSFYVFDDIFSKTELSNYLRPISTLLKNNNIWFSLRPAAFTDSVGDYVTKEISSEKGYSNYIYMTNQTRDYCLKTKELILYHNLNDNTKNLVKNILNLNIEITDEDTIKILIP